MEFFEDIQDVQEWLAPMDYREFWDAVMPYNLFPAGDRAHCDRLLATGKASEALMLEALKGLAETTLSTRLGLLYRIYEPTSAKYTKSIH